MILNFKAKDYIALVTLVGCGTLMSLHIDGVVSAIMLSVVAYYFGRRQDTEPIIKKP